MPVAVTTAVVGDANGVGPTTSRVVALAVGKLIGVGVAVGGGVAVLGGAGSTITYEARRAANGCPCSPTPWQPIYWMPGVSKLSS